MSCINVDLRAGLRDQRGGGALAHGPHDAVFVVVVFFLLRGSVVLLASLEEYQYFQHVVREGFSFDVEAWIRASSHTLHKVSGKRPSGQNAGGRRGVRALLSRRVPFCVCSTLLA